MKKFITLMLTLPLAVAAWGAQAPPCKLTFTSQEQFDQWKMVDANNDGQGSKYVFAFNKTEEVAYYTQTTKSYLPANDWIISPAITLTRGKQYIITVSVRNYSKYSSDENAFNVSYGTAQTVEGQTVLLNVTGLKKSEAYVDKSSQTFTVENSGDYYFGIHLVSKGWSGDFGVKSFTIAENVELPEKITGASVAPAALGEMKAELAWTNPSNNSDGGTLTALSGVRIYRQYLSKTNVVSNANLIATIAEGVTPGSRGTYTDTNFTEGSGTYYYAIVPYNENGASLVDPELASAWIGEEIELKRVNNLKAALDSDNDQHVLLSWDTPPQGANGAYVNPEKISYRILRDDVVLKESWTGELPYKDTTVPGVGKYNYVVYALYNGKASTYSSKTTITVKGVATLPYSNTFDTKYSVDDFTFVHASPGTRDWKFSSQAISVWESGTPNAFAFLPAFMLKAGKIYGVTFDTKVSGASSKNLSVVYGATATADGTHKEVFREAITSTAYVKKTAAFTVPADGKYYIGFRFDGETTDYKDLYVDNVKVEELVEAPQPVGELTATVGAEGALEVALSWINPSLTNTGSNLTEITKVVVAREGVEVNVVDKPAPGATGSFTDNTVPAPGIYHYTVTPYLNDNAAKAAEVVTAWVGSDTPKAPASVTVTSNADGRTVTFEAVSESANGGYMPAELTYTVSRNGVVLAEDLTKTSYLDSESNLPLGLYTYSVCAGYGDVTGQSASSDAVQLGEMLQLPYTPDFTNAQEFTLWNLDKGESTQDWELDNEYFFGLAIYRANDSWAYTPPFEAIMGKIKVTFVAAAQYPTPETLTVSLVRDAKEETPEEPSLAPTKAKAGDAWNHETVGSSTNYTIEEWLTDSEFTTRTLDFDIPETGKYYVGFGANVGATTRSQGRFVLKKSDVKQSYISGLESIASDGAGFAYSATSQALLSTLPGRIEVFSLEGSLLLQGEGTTLATDGLVAGIYLARFTGNDGSSAVVKFVR